MSNLLKITVQPWWKSLQRDPLWHASNIIKKATSPSNTSKSRRRPRRRRKQLTSPTRSPISTPSSTTKPRPRAITTSSRRRTIARWLHIWLGERIRDGTNPFGCPRKSSLTWRSPNRFGFQRKLKALCSYGDLETWFIKWSKGSSKEAKCITLGVLMKIMIIIYPNPHPKVKR